MTAEELAGAIPKRILSRAHWSAIEIARDVLGQLIHGCIPALVLLAHRHQDNIIEIARQLTRQAGSHGHAAGAWDLSLANDTLDFRGGICVNFLRPHFCE